MIAGLWVLSIVGNWCNFLTLFYIGNGLLYASCISYKLNRLALNTLLHGFNTAFVLLHTLPVFYEKYEDQVDTFAQKAHAEIKKQYAVIDAKVLSKIPRGPLKNKKKD